MSTRCPFLCWRKPSSVAFLLLLSLVPLAVPAATFGQGAHPLDFSGGSPLSERARYKAQVLQQVDSVLSRWTRAWDADDTVSVGRLYEDDAALYADDGRRITGRSAIAREIAQERLGLGYVQRGYVDFDISGELAYKVENAIYDTGGGDLRRTEMLVLARQPRGNWLIRSHLVRVEREAEEASHTPRLAAPILPPAPQAWTGRALDLMKKAEDRLRAGDWAGYGDAWNRLRDFLKSPSSGGG